MKKAWFLLVVAALGAASCRDRPRPASEAPVTAASYVGIDACKTCHPVQYEAYVQAEMGRSFKPATLSSSAARFEGVGPVYDAELDRYYQPFHRGEALFIKEYRLSGRDTVFQRVEQIDYIVGSGQHTNSHIRDVNGHLYQMPLTWYAQDGRWDLPPKFARGNNYRFGRPITVECMACHNARAAFVAGSENRFTAVPAGIDCERCHGPGSLHVAATQAGQVSTAGEGDTTIVNPRRLTPDRQIDLCQRCHMQGAAVYRPGRTAYDFRPGQRLADTENVFWPRFADSTQRFLMASHPDRLRMSACYAGARAAGSGYPPMTCSTCHDPHLPIAASRAEGRLAHACRTCHTTERENLCTRPGAPPDEASPACASCHMPASGSSDIPHVRITDHFIRTPGTSPPAAGQDLVRLAGLIDPAPGPRDVADGYLTYYEEFSNHPGFLDSAAVYLARARQRAGPGTLTPSLVRLWFLRQDHAAVIRLARSLDAGVPLDAWTLYRIGEAFYQSGDVAGAIPYLRRAVDAAPEHLRFGSRLALAYTRAGQLEDAVALLDRILAADPTFEEAYNTRGFAHLLRRSLAEAEADFQAALALDPDAEQPLANLASLYYNTGRGDAARPYVRRLRALDPENEDYRMLERLVNAD